MARQPAGKGKRRCQKGDECGNSCIAKTKVCRHDPPAPLQAKIEAVAAKVKETKEKKPKKEGMSNIRAGGSSKFMDNLLEKELTPLSAESEKKLKSVESDGSEYAPKAKGEKAKVDTTGMTRSEAALARAKAEFTRKGRKEFDATDFNDVGSLKLPQIDQIVGNYGKATEDQVEAVSKGLRLATYTVVPNSGKNDDYKVIARGEFVDAAKKNGQDRAWILGIPDDPKQISLTQKLANVKDLPPVGSLKKDNKGDTNKDGKGSDFANEGKLMYLPAEDIKNSDGVSHGRSKREVEETATQLLKAGGRGWVPVYVQETSEYNYKVVGNSFAHDVYKAAGIDREWTIVVRNGDNYKEALSQ